VEKINLLNVSAETCVTCVTEPQNDCLVSTPAVTQPSEKMCNRCVTRCVTSTHLEYSMPLLEVGTKIQLVKGSIPSGERIATITGNDKTSYTTSLGISILFGEVEAGCWEVLSP
jgi:hypothetical protein